MADNITFHQYNNLHDIEDSWRSLDQQAERLSLGYIHYTYYQTYEWNEFLYHHTLRGLGALTTAMRYDLVRVGGRPFAILPMAVTRSSKKARIPSCRVGGVLNMVCPYPYEGHEEVMEAIAAHLRSSCQGMTLSLADVPCCTALARIMRTLSPDPIERTSFHVPLSQFASHEAYVASLPKNIYKNIRKAYNHLTTDGKTMELKVFDHAHQAPAHTLRHLWRFYFRRKMMWRSQKANALTHLTTTLKAIYEVKSGCATASLRQLPCAELYVLEIDHQPASFMIVYRHRDHLLMPPSGHRHLLWPLFARYPAHPGGRQALDDGGCRRFRHVPRRRKIQKGNGWHQRTAVPHRNQGVEIKSLHPGPVFSYILYPIYSR